MDTTLTHVGASPLRERGEALRDPGDVPNYDLLRFIKAGGFGDVWLARERVTGVRRAIKVVFKSDGKRTARDLTGVRRYQRCAHNHPHLLQILTVGETEHCFYYVMEAADNAASGSDDYAPTTLRTVMNTGQRFDGPNALACVQKLLSGVARLHEQGLAHYDLKPDNILMVDGEPKIADVGLMAAVDAPPPGSGTPYYVTPEGVANDLYALGKILYELLSGRSAREFPDLPADLVDAHTPEIAAAVQIMNRASHNQPASRFPSADTMAAVIALHLHRRKGIIAGWRRLRRPVRRVALAMLATAAILLGLAGVLLYVRVVPVRLFELDERFESQETLHYMAPPAEPDGTYPYLCVAGRPLAGPGWYKYRLDRSCEYFVADFHFRCTRPWGSLVVCCTEGGANAHSLAAGFSGQPDGMGLQTYLSIRGPAGQSTKESDPIEGLPQPGLEYIVRLARGRDSLVLCLWPLAVDWPHPIVRTLDLPRSPILLRHILFSTMSGDPLARVDLLGMHVTGYSVPLADPAAKPPGLVLAGPRPAAVPPLRRNHEPPTGNLLAGETHPYSSTSWMPIGSWSWWSGVQRGTEPKPIRCVPCSKEQRSGTTDAERFQGLQFLRFDGARYRDFEARARIRIADPEDPDTQERDPFPAPSHSGVVGLAFRLQDDAPEGCAWGGGYIAYVGLDPDADIPAWIRLDRHGGLVLSALRNHTHVATDAASRTALAKVTGVSDRAEVLAPEGFVLTVRAVGPEIAVYINERPQPVLTAYDSSADYFREGRIALYTFRLIATFDSLEVAPLPAE